MKTIMKLNCLPFRLFLAAVLSLSVAELANAQRGRFNNNNNNNGGQDFGGGSGRTRRNFSGGGFNGGGFNGGNRSVNIQHLPNTGNFNEDYGVLYEHNIFLRDRAPRPDPGSGRVTIPLTPEQTYVLTGVTQQDGQSKAYLEDVSNGSVLILGQGAAIARGKLSEITLDQVRYEHDGVQTWVSVGANLTGSQVGSVSEARIGAQMGGIREPGSGIPSSAGPSDFGGGRRGGGGFTGGGAAPTIVAPPPLPGDPNMSMEERLRLRRLQEGLPSAARTPAAPAEAPAATEAPAAPAAEAAQPPLPVPGSNLSIEEQMRLRRAQQTGQ